jgi:hypothetical protein
LDVLRKNSIERRITSRVTYYNIDYFAKIDSHDKAYILGFILTDGYIIRDYSGVGIQITKSDGYLLKKIAKIFGKSTSVVKISLAAKRKTKPNVKDMIRLSVHSKKFTEHLKKMGVIRNKSLILHCPHIGKKYLSSFCRGLFDGDGTIGIAKTNNIWCNLVSGSPFFLPELQEMLKSTRFVFNLRGPYPKLNMMTLSVAGGNKETIKFLRWMYQYKGDLYLKRKYAIIKNKIC